MSTDNINKRNFIVDFMLKWGEELLEARKSAIFPSSLIEDKKENASDCIVTASRKNIEAEDLKSLVANKSYLLSKKSVIDTVLEWLISLKINTLQRKFPTFQYSLGIVTDKPILVLRRDSLPDKAAVLYSTLPKTSFREWCEKSYNQDIALRIFTIIVLSLQKAGEKIGFSHGNLTVDNIFLADKETTLIFKIGSLDYTVTSPLVPIITKYNDAEVIHKRFRIASHAFEEAISACSYNGLGRPSSYDVQTLLRSIINIKNLKEKWDNFSFFTNLAPVSYADMSERMDLMQEPLSWIESMRTRYVELMSFLQVSSRKLISSRYTGPKTLSGQQALMLSPSATWRLAAGVPRKDITEIENNWDQKLIDNYEIYVSSSSSVWVTKKSSSNPKYPLFRLPLTAKFINGVEVEFEKSSDRLFLYSKIISNFIYFLRLAFKVKTITEENGTLKLKIPLSQIFEAKSYLYKETQLLCDMVFYLLYASIYDKNWLSENSEQIIRFISIHFSSLYEQTKKALKDKLNSNYIPPYSLRTMLRLPKIPGIEKLLGRVTGQKITLANLLKQAESGENDLILYKNMKTKKNLEEDPSARALRRIKEIKPIIERVNIKEINTILDFGAGDGSISAAIAETFPQKKVTGIDLTSWLGTTEVKTNLADFVKILPGIPLPFKDSQFDLSICLQVLHHVSDLNQTLSELVRISKRYLFIREHDCDNDDTHMLIDCEHSLWELAREVPNLTILSQKTNYHSKKWWINTLKNYGWKDIHTTNPVGVTRNWYGLFEKV